MSDFHASFMIRKQAAAHTQALQSWKRKVLACGSLRQALQAAQHAPAPGSLLRGLRQLTNQDECRARQAIEAHLLTLLRKSAPEGAALHESLRLSQGHWPRINRALHDIRTKQAGP